MRKLSGTEIQVKTTAILYAQGVIIDVLTTTIIEGKDLKAAKEKLQTLLDLKDQSFDHCTSITPEAKQLKSEPRMSERTKRQHFITALAKTLTNHLAATNT